MSSLARCDGAEHTRGFWLDAHLQLSASDHHHHHHFQMAPTPSDTLVLFARGVIVRLATWPALRVAVESGWGGPESAAKRTWIATVIVDAFEPSNGIPETPDECYGEETLLRIMADEFDTELEDGSAKEIAKDVIRLWSALESNGGGKRLVEDWEDRARKTKDQKVLSKVVECDDFIRAVESVRPTVNEDGIKRHVQ